MNGNLKSRYMSFKLNGEEVYIEDLPTTGNIKNSLKIGREKFALLKKAMPKADWIITIEQQSQKNDDGYFEILDVETGKLQSQTL